MCNINLFTYGSLMNLNELENMFGDVTYEKCWLSGYVRDFSKIAHSWGDEKDVGVLGIMPEPTKKVNGLLISNLSKSDLDKYAKRETGYEFNVAKEKETGYIFVNVDKSRIKSYKNKSINISDNIITVVTNRRLNEPNIHKEYKELCHSAAKSHGENFYNDFCDTTFEYY